MDIRQDGVSLEDVPPENRYSLVVVADGVVSTGEVVDPDEPAQDDDQ